MLKVMFHPPAVSSAPTVTTLIPQSVMGSTPGGGTTPVEANSNTTMFVGQIYVPANIVVNYVSIFETFPATQSGTGKISLYSADGQTRLFSVTTPTMGGGGAVNTTYTASVPSVTLTPGIYWIAFNSVSTTDLTFSFWTTGNTPFASSTELGGALNGRACLEGTYTITASTPPSTLTLSSISYAGNSTIVFRLDN